MADKAAAAAATASERARRLQETGRGVARGSRQFGSAVWRPLVRLSGVLWLELTGVFYGLFLLTAAVSAWKLRGDLHDRGVNHAGHVHLLWAMAVAAVFGYFCVSSFVRAGRRQRGRD